MSRFGDLDDDVLVQLVRWLSCDQVLKLRATDKRWHLVLKRPSALLGCEEVEKKVLYWLRLPLQSYMWVRLLGSGCTKLTLYTEKTKGELPGLDEALARESLMRCSNLRELMLQACVVDLAALSRLLNGVVPRLRILNMSHLVETPPTQASVADLASACPTIEQTSRTTCSRTCHFRGSSLPPISPCSRPCHFRGSSLHQPHPCK